MGLLEKIEKSKKSLIINQICKILEKDPEKNIDKIFATIRKLVKDEESISTINKIEEYYKDNPVVKEEIKNILKNTNSNCMQSFFRNFLANAVWTGMPKRKKYFEEKGVKIPFSILISPSMRCNLHCKGCYAADYPKDEGLTYEEVDRIVKEARDLGIYYFVVLGGEPFFVQYMFDIYKKYNDVMFTPFTNGSLINEEIAEKLVKLGNVMPIFSLEGFEKETDERRGKGTFQKVMKAMDLLRKKGVPFGVSSATSTHNMDTVSSNEFIDMLIKKGSKMSWYFIYMPVGEKPDISNMLKPEQRIELGRRVRNIRNTKTYFAIDFFNDAPYVGGCIAGKFYCHINSKGDVEPCIFAHISEDNIKEKKLIDVFKGNLFKELRERQPYNENMLMPCMMIDNPKVIREVAKKVQVHPTEESADAMLNDEEFQKELDKLASDFKPYADRAWIEDFNSKGNDEFSKG
ncbi:MAG: radical SAM protein [Clostridium sp.]|nr:radical SAM protein [Clostridium sp.]